jgi:hypothetical protein
VSRGTIERNLPIIDLLALIKLVVIEAGGQVDSITRSGKDKVVVTVSGLPEGPLTEKQERAAEWLESVGIKCREKQQER